MNYDEKEAITTGVIKLPKINGEDATPNDDMAGKPLGEIVFETIRQAIIQGDLKPGQRLMEIQMAEELGVSRTPVREAIRKLELEGFVSMVPRKGAYVTPLSIEDLEDMMQIRAALEALAAQLAAVKASDEEVEELCRTNDLFEQAVMDNDEREIMKSDIRFHDALYSASGNAKLKMLTNSLREQMQRIRVLYIKNIPDKKELIGQHARVIQAIKEHDGEIARDVSRDHISTTESDMVKVLSALNSPVPAARRR